MFIKAQHMTLPIRIMQEDLIHTHCPILCNSSDSCLIFNIVPFFRIAFCNLSSFVQNLLKFWMMLIARDINIVGKRGQRTISLKTK